MRMISRRAEAELEAPFRTPEQLALAMPLVAMIGLMVVVSAVATGGSATVVALVALGGFGLCAIAPMALIDVYVTRPLRGALAQVRAAREGKAGQGAFASGAVADLVHLARDIHAAQANLGACEDVYAQCERMIAAGDEAVRALRLQGEEIAGAGDRRDELSLRAEIAQLAGAVTTLRAAPASPVLDGAVERLESMLVYIAESLERIEAKDRHVEGGFAQVEQGIADLSRLVSRETETIQGALSSGGLAARADIAGVAAEHKLGRARVLERLDALEASLSAKLGEAPSPDAREIAEAIHAEAEANRRALREEAANGRLEVVAAELSRAATEMAQARAEQPAGVDLAGVRADLQAVAAEISGKIDEVRARLDETGRAPPLPETAQVAASGEALATIEAALAARLSEQSEIQARRLDEIEGRVVEKVLALGRDNEATTLTALMRAAKQIAEAADWLDSLGVRPAFDGADRPSLEAWQRLEGEVRGVTGALAALSSEAKERLDAIARQIEGEAARLSGEVRDIEPLREILGGTETRLAGALADVAARIEAIEEQALAPASAALAGAAQDFAAAQARIEAGDPRLAEASEGLRARLDDFAETLAARLDAAALVPAREAMIDAAQRFETAQSQLSQAAAQIEAGDPRLAAAVEALAQTLPAALDPALATLGEAASAFGAAQARFDEDGVKALREDIAAMQARFEQIVEVAATHLTALGVERLPEVAQDLRETQARWRELVGAFETGAQKLAALAETEGRDIDALRADFAAAGENVCATVAAFAARFDAEAEAQIEKLSHAVEAHSGRVVAAPLAALSQAMGGIEAALADVSRAAATQQALDGLRADFAAAAEAAAAKFDDAAQGLSRSVEDRIETLRRGELSPAIAAAQATAQDLHTAHASLFSHIEALKAALLTDRSSFASLRLDVVEAFAKVAAISERADVAMREAGERSDALATRVADLGAAERAELGAISQALAETSERVAVAARAFEDKRGDLDLPTLAADLTREIDTLGRAAAALAGEAGEALGTMRATAQALDVAGIADKLDGFAQTHDAGLRALESRLAPPVAEALSEARDLARQLQDTLATRGENLVEAVAENSARLDALARLQDERLDGLEKLLSAEPNESGARARPLTLEAKPSGAVAKLVVSMADALDFRFSHIETALAELAQRLQAPEVRRDDDALDAGVAALTTQLQSASDTLRSGLSDFVGVSAALAQEVARSGGAETSPATKAAAYKH